MKLELSNEENKKLQEEIIRLDNGIKNDSNDEELQLYEKYKHTANYLNSKDEFEKQKDEREKLYNSILKQVSYFVLLGLFLFFVSSIRDFSFISMVTDSNVTNEIRTQINIINSSVVKTDSNMTLGIMNTIYTHHSINNILVFLFYMGIIFLFYKLVYKIYEELE
jgi:hypothetical protein